MRFHNLVGVHKINPMIIFEHRLLIQIRIIVIDYTRKITKIISSKTYRNIITKLFTSALYILVRMIKSPRKPKIKLSLASIFERENYRNITNR